ncbi:MAG TPA: hypothetical protein VIO13_05250 [Candidatus Dormibacteraeota bacterium]|jgi:hypothetical protein
MSICAGGADDRHSHGIAGVVAGGGRSALDFKERRKENDATTHAGMKMMAAPTRSPNGCPPDVIGKTFEYPTVGDPGATK